MTDPQQGGRAPAAPPQSFAALRHPGYRAYFAGSALAMMADSIEHVISYWIIFQKFHSPALGGFAMLSHWLPFLFFSVLSGALADRFDPRRLIQIGMALFMIASLGWGVLFLTGKLEMWHAAALLVIHGFAGVFWHPSAQLLIHDIVGTANLQSAVRLSATARYLGLLLGPAVGGGFLLDATNAPVTLVVAGTCGTVVTAVAALTLPRAMRRSHNAPEWTNGMHSAE